MKNEFTEVYQLGYKMGFKTCIRWLRKHVDDNELVGLLLAAYSRDPVIDKIITEEISNEPRPE